MIMIIYLATSGLSCSTCRTFIDILSCGSGSVVAHRFSCSMVCWESQFPGQGLEHVSPALQGRFRPLNHQGSPLWLLLLLESWQDQMVPEPRIGVPFLFLILSSSSHRPLVLPPWTFLVTSSLLSPSSQLSPPQSPLVATSHCVRAWFPSVYKGKL